MNELYIELGRPMADIRRDKQSKDAMGTLIDIVLNEYPETDDRYKTALAIGIEFGIIEGDKENT